MLRALTGAIVCILFVILIVPAQTLPPWWSAVLLSTLIGVPGTTGALNGALMHTMIRSSGIARATGVYVGLGNVVSVVGPVLFGVLIGTLGGRYWGGFLFLALVNAGGAVAYFVLHRQASRAIRNAGASAAIVDVVVTQ
jgi:hypothetical protein